MGHGWHGKERVISEVPCSCKKGFIIKYLLEEECDYPPFERTNERTEYTCPDKCHIKK
ncbi:hypothetical protein [Neobacillus jeddahensis]|uniref:hypothetical protein n=1 Tax=Neobacillus jeddahensis TaxID=1461580 RepID=UPI0012EE9A9E|nr:hypothetical protein [Neobacillus jeddahensis]